MLLLIILILSFISGLFLPWWVIALIAFIAAYICGKRPGRSFLAGFGGVFIAWCILILWKSIPNDNMLASRVIQLFPLPHWWILLLFISALIGGLVGGMSALSGALVKQAFKK
jgi:hypothetical protein